jgi:stalled ribosome rescue protein Dom34
MNDFVVWLDSKDAHVFAMKTTGIEKSIVSKSEKDHHTRHKNDKHKDSHSDHYYRDLAKKLKGADQILLIGPGLAKNHFKDHLTTHEANLLAKKIIGLENMESFAHKTEKQMMAKANQFFRKYDLFHNPI